MGNKSTHIHISNASHNNMNNYMPYLSCGVADQDLQAVIEIGKEADGFYHQKLEYSGTVSVGGVIKYNLKDHKPPMTIAIMVAVPNDHKYMLVLGIFQGEIPCDEVLYKKMYEGTGDNIKRVFEKPIGYEQKIPLTAYGITINATMVEQQDKLELRVIVKE